MSLLCLRRPGFWWKGAPSLSDPHEAEPVLKALNLGWWGLGRDPPPLLKAGAWLWCVAPADLGGGLRAGGEVAPTTLWVCLEHLICCRGSGRVDGALAVWGVRAGACSWGFSFGILSGPIPSFIRGGNEA